MCVCFWGVVNIVYLLLHFENDYYNRNNERRNHRNRIKVMVFFPRSDRIRKLLIHEINFGLVSTSSSAACFLIIKSYFPRPFNWCFVTTWWLVRYFQGTFSMAWRWQIKNSWNKNTSFMSFIDPTSSLQLPYCLSF